MSGHSKWSNIKRRKGAQDEKRGKLFTKLARAITVAAKTGGADISANPRLKHAVEKAKGANMPNANIDRAIKRGSGKGEGEEFMEVVYEGYGPGGTAFMVHCLTDNRNRAIADVREVFKKFGGSLGEPGSAAYVFESDPSEAKFKVDLDSETSSKIKNMLSDLENLDDVQDVYHNANFSP